MALGALSFHHVQQVNSLSLREAERFGSRCRKLIEPCDIAPTAYVQHVKSPGRCNRRDPQVSQGAAALMQKGQIYRTRKRFFEHSLSLLEFPAAAKVAREVFGRRLSRKMHQPPGGVFSVSCRRDDGHGRSAFVEGEGGSPLPRDAKWRGRCVSVTLF